VQLPPSCATSLGQEGVNILSTGKSSNSSSSSSAAAGLPSLDGEALLSDEAAAVEAGAAPDVGAAGMTGGVTGGGVEKNTVRGLRRRYLCRDAKEAWSILVDSLRVELERNGVSEVWYYSDTPICS
jgi:hypothetical protein